MTRMISAATNRRASSLGSTRTARAKKIRARAAWCSRTERTLPVADAAAGALHFLSNVRLGAAEPREIVLRQIEPAATVVHGNVAKNVRQLQRDAQIARVIQDGLFAVAEDLGAHQPNG